MREESGVSNTNEQQVKEDWFSLWEVGKELGIPYSPENLPLLQEQVEGCPERPHEKANLAAKGHKEYFCSLSGKFTKKQEKKRTVTGVKEQDVTVDEFNKVCEMIDKEPFVPAVPGRLLSFLIQH